MTNQELQTIYCGSYAFRETEDGYLQAFQYSEAQIQYFRAVLDFWFERCIASSAKTLEMETAAENLTFEYRIIWEGSQDSFELAVNNLISDIQYIKDLPKEGRLDWKLPAGKKNVTIYLPADATVLIRNCEMDGAFTPVRKKTKVLWLGDSITQGYGPLRSGQTYVSVANRILNYDILNQGIGGYIYDKNSLMKMDGYTPDKIIVALGTNQMDYSVTQNVEEYYEALMKIYGDKTPVLCILPLWRGDIPDKYQAFVRYRDNIRKITMRYPNVTTVDGFELVPHLPEYYIDNLHPNALGAEVYGRNLADIIRSTGF